MRLHVIFTRLRPGHLSVHVGDGSRRIEKIVKSRIAPLSAIMCMTMHIRDQGIAVSPQWRRTNDKKDFPATTCWGLCVVGSVETYQEFPEVFVSKSVTAFRLPVFSVSKFLSCARGNLSFHLQSRLNGACVHGENQISVPHLVFY